jgi:hypothetical protein
VAVFDGVAHLRAGLCHPLQAPAHGRTQRDGADRLQRCSRRDEPIHIHDEGMEFKTIRPQRRPAELDHLEQGELARHAAQR